MTREEIEIEKIKIKAKAFDQLSDRLDESGLSAQRNMFMRQIVSEARGEIDRLVIKHSKAGM